MRSNGEMVGVAKDEALARKVSSSPNSSTTRNLRRVCEWHNEHQPLLQAKAPGRRAAAQPPPMLEHRKLSSRRRAEALRAALCSVPLCSPYAIYNATIREMAAIRCPIPRSNI